MVLGSSRHLGILYFHNLLLDPTLGEDLDSGSSCRLLFGLERLDGVNNVSTRVTGGCRHLDLQKMVLKPYQHISTTFKYE